jgi:HPt (histidine-containing phosphotransfer) domain-containing protein
VAACFAAGCQAHLAKPLQMADLDRAIRKWLGKERGSRKPAAISGDLRVLYEKRKAETLAALDLLVTRGSFDNEMVSSVAELLHKLAGTAAMFGEAQLGRLSRDLEVGLARWTAEEREARLADCAAAIQKAA